MNILDTLLTLDWFKVSQGIISICMVLIAYNALSTWKEQLKAKIILDFLNELTESVHEFILLMSAPHELVKFVSIGIEVNSYPLPGEEKQNIKNPEFVRYIKKDGKDMSSRIQKHLNACRPVASKVSSLAAKGQVFSLKNYERCQNVCKMLLWQFNYIESLSMLIASTTLNWSNELVQKNLSQYSKVDADDLKEKMRCANSDFLKYIKECYAHIYN